MEEINACVAAEAMKVLYNTNIELVSKIPYKILDCLQQLALEYENEIELQENVPLKDQPISDEAKAVLSIIYKDYWCDDTKKSELNDIFQQNQEKYDKEQETKYSVDNLFKNKHVYNNEALVVVNKKKWYEKIFEKIKNIFR